MKEIVNTWDNINDDKLSKRKARLPKPTPVDREIIFNNNLVLLSITDLKGVIEYCNDDFVEISGYEEYELAGSAHNIIRHPDMPRVIFKLMWSRIQKKQNVVALIKNMSKTGRYYWVYTDFVVKEDKQGNITGYKAYRKAAPRKAIETIVPIYKKLKEIEDAKGIEVAEKFLHGYLDGKGTHYDRFIESLIIDNLPKTEITTKEVVAKETTPIEKTTPIKEVPTTKTKTAISSQKKPKTSTERKSFFKKLFGY